MHYRAGGEQQQPHKGYTEADVTAVQVCRPGCVPSSMIFALQPGARLLIYAGCFDLARPDREREIKTPVGFVHIFRGDILHCGAAYSYDNFRLHCYLNFPSVNWVPDIVTNGTVLIKWQLYGHVMWTRPRTACASTGSPVLAARTERNI